MASANDPMQPTELGSDSQPGATTRRPLDADRSDPGHDVDPATPGRTLGRYVVLGTLGHGAMGTVLRAYDQQLDRAVALKLLRHRTAQRHAERLRREAQGLAKLSHPNVVHVYEVGQLEGQWFIAMELVPGKTLKAWQEDVHSWRECVEVYLGAGAGLAAAHGVDLVHRDFKPDNCIVDSQGQARVLDFGLVRQTGAPSESGWKSGSELGLELGLELGSKSPVYAAEASISGSLTRTGAVVGTVAYMPLEQFEGRPADARSDQFGFCVALYEAVYGQRPFAGEGVAELMLALAQQQVQPPPPGSRVPARLRRVLLRGLAKPPDERWPSMEALLVELRRIVAPRRIGPWVGAGVGVAAAIGASVSLWPRAEPATPCLGAQARLEGVWDDERRQVVQAAILETGLSYAADTWARVEPQLDAYSNAWVARHTEVCEATSVRQEQSSDVMDLRMECLRGRLVSLQGSVEVLAHANEARVGKAIEIVVGLPGLSRCDDVEALRAELPPPEDPQRAEAVAVQRRRLAHARTARTMGEYSKTLEVTESVLVQADALEYGPLRAEALLLRGHTRIDKAQYARAESDLQQAYVLAVELGYQRLQTTAASFLVVVVGKNLARHEQGLQWGTTALALTRAPHAEPDAQGMALSSIASVLMTQGKLEEALTLHQRTLAVWEQTLHPDAPNVAHTLNNIGIVLMRQGQMEEALTHHQRAQAIRERALGSDHPDVAGSMTNVANVLLSQGSVSESLAHHRRALAILERALGPDHPDVATAVLNVGVALTELGQWDESVEYYERGLAIRTRALGTEHPEVASASINMGFLLRSQGRLSEALAYHQRALAIFEPTLGPEHPSVALSLNNIGLVLLDQGELEPARVHFERALSIWEQALGSKHPHLAYSLLGLANVALAHSNAPVARGHAERAVSIVESAEVSPERLAEARFILARALWSDRRERSGALELARRARDAYTERGDLAREPRVEVNAWLMAHESP